MQSEAHRCQHQEAQQGRGPAGLVENRGQREKGGGAEPSQAEEIVGSMKPAVTWSVRAQPQRNPAASRPKRIIVPTSPKGQLRKRAAAIGPLAQT